LSLLAQLDFEFGNQRLDLLEAPGIMAMNTIDTTIVHSLFHAVLPRSNADEPDAGRRGISMG